MKRIIEINIESLFLRCLVLTEDESARYNASHTHFAHALTVFICILETLNKVC